LLAHPPRTLQVAYKPAILASANLPAFAVSTSRALLPRQDTTGEWQHPSEPKSSSPAGGASAETEEQRPVAGRGRHPECRPSLALARTLVRPSCRSGARGRSRAGGIADGEEADRQARRHPPIAHARSPCRSPLSCSTVRFATLVSDHH